MKVVILAGGYGERFGVETAALPKPLIEVAGKPILHRVMEMFADQGFSDFVIALGYRGDQVKRYFADAVCSQFEALPATGVASWRIAFVDTGLGTTKVDRLRQIRPHVGDAPFLLAHCDGLSDISFAAMLAAHRRQARAVTIAAVQPPSRFGRMRLRDETEGCATLVSNFDEKPIDADVGINGGLYVIEPAMFDYCQDAFSEWETEVLPRLAAAGQLAAFRHDGFWACMDTPEDRAALTVALERLGPLAMAPRQGVAAE